MKELALVFSGDIPEVNNDKIIDRIIVHWEERNIPPGHISLPSRLDAALLSIRAEHMRWACDFGLLPLENGQNVQSMLEGGHTPSMWWTSLLYERHPKLSPNLYIIYKLRCVENILAENDCDSLLLIGADKTTGKILEDMCARIGCDFRQQGGYSCAKEKNPFRERLYRILPARFRAILRYAHWQWKIRRHLPFVGSNFGSEASASTQEQATIVTYFPNIDLQAAGRGHFRSRYWEKLHDLLNEEARKINPHGQHFVRWVFIRFPSPQLSFSQCRELRDLFRKTGTDGLSFNYLEEFLDSGDIRAAIRRWSAICHKSSDLRKLAMREAHFANSNINFWTLIREQWDESFCGWRCLERCLQNFAFRHYAKLAGPQRWNLFPLENCPWERMFTEASRSIPENGPVFGAQHSIIRPTDFRYFDDARTFSEAPCAAFQPDKIGGNGASATGQLAGNGMPPHRLIQLEALRYLYLARKSRASAIQDNLPPNPGEPLENPSQKRLLVLTSFFRDETDAHLLLLGNALDAGLLKNWQIRLKPHPYLPVDEWLAQRPEDQQKNIQIIASPMDIALAPGIFVWASNSTTAALEAALKNLPLMVMAPHNDFDLCPIQNVPGLIRTSRVEDVRNGLANMRTVDLGPDYLDLDASLRAWKKLLGLG